MTFRQDIEGALKAMEVVRTQHSDEAHKHANYRNLDEAQFYSAMAHEVSKCMKLIEGALNKSPVPTPKEPHYYMLAIGMYDTAEDLVYACDRELSWDEFTALLKKTWFSTTKAKVGEVQGMGNMLNLLMADAGFTAIAPNIIQGCRLFLDDIKSFATAVDVGVLETYLEKW